MQLLIAAAGTGGHIFPALEFAKLCIVDRHEVIWIGAGQPMECKLVPGSNITLLSIPMSGFRGKSIANKASSVMRLCVSILKSIYYILSNKIECVVCFGGYVSLPVGIAAIICRRSLVLHEQNCVLGTANKLLTKFSDLVFLGLPLAKGQNKNMQIVGNPIRGESTKDLHHSTRNQSIRIYVTGGSQGSEFINQNIPLALNAMKQSLEVRHQSGFNKSAGIAELYSSNISAEIEEFYSSPQDLLSWCDFIICRAGALTLSEAMSASRGCLMIPLPGSIDNHQFCNASYIQSSNKGIIHEEKELEADLLNKLDDILSNKLYLDWQVSKNYIDHLQAASRMLSCIVKLK